MASSLNIPFYTTRVDDVLLRKDVGFILICTPPSLQPPSPLRPPSIGTSEAVAPDRVEAEAEQPSSCSTAWYFERLQLKSHSSMLKHYFLGDSLISLLRTCSRCWRC